MDAPELHGAAVSGSAAVRAGAGASGAVRPGHKFFWQHSAGQVGANYRVQGTQLGLSIYLPVREAPGASRGHAVRHESYACVTSAH